MYGCESWTVKKAERWRIDAFELWCWRRLFRVPWTTRRSNQSVLREIIFECSLEGLILKLISNTLVTWCKEPTHWKRPWCWKRLKVGGEGDDRGWDVWMVSPTWWTWIEQAPGVGGGEGGLACCTTWGRKEVHMTELNWTEVAKMWSEFSPCDSHWVSFHHIIPWHLDTVCTLQRDNSDNSCSETFTLAVLTRLECTRV